MSTQIIPRESSQRQAFAAAGRVLAVGLMKVLTSDPREAAERAYIPKVTPDVDELERCIRRFQDEAHRESA